MEPTGALGILESFNVATLLQAADAARKAANVTLLEIRLAMALGGKAFVTHDRRCGFRASRSGGGPRRSSPKPACWSTPSSFPARIRTFIAK